MLTRAATAPAERAVAAGSRSADAYVRAAAALLRGFAAEFALEPSELSVLRTLVACRLAISVTLGAYSQQQDPDNAYLSLHAQPGWLALEAFWRDADAREVDAAFATAATPVNRAVAVFEQVRNALRAEHESDERDRARLAAARSLVAVGIALAAVLVAFGVVRARR